MTPQQWWDKTKNDPVRLADWLKRQYRGEITAAKRILRYAAEYADQIDPYTVQQLGKLASDELRHAQIVKGLMDSRSIKPMPQDEAEDRYWKKVLPSIASLDTFFAVGAHAEAMRLERIKVIYQDSTAPYDIVNAFGLIYRDEMWHAEFFRGKASESALKETEKDHEAGLQVLGLEI
jgi:tRNA isopentenyl-2-thiomethyl-A-37 hydroxylase MiaE